MKDVAVAECPECRSVDRRDFVRTLAAGTALSTLGVAAAGVATRASATEKGPMPRVVNAAAEELVRELHSTLSADQQKLVVKPWNHKDRRSVNPNKALDKTIDVVYSKTQQELLVRIVKAIGAGEDGWHQISRAGTWDASKTFDQCGADIFGDPSTGKFAFLFTGHHLTVRCDGDAEAGAAFGGPIYYGHTPFGYNERNVFHYQTREVAKVFEALDPKQRDAALVHKGTPGEGAGSVRLVKDARHPGIAYADLKKDQQALVESVMKAVLSPFRQEDGQEVVSIIKAMGGMEKVHLAFYTEPYEDTKTTAKNPWSFWRLQGPGFVWNYRVLPHVHTFVNISSKIG
jgi:Protein of unknown function (DUF3500)